MPNEFVAKNGLVAQNNSVVSGSLVVTNGITGSLFGTSSQALSASFTATSSFGLNAISASYAFTASSASNSFSASFAQTSSFANNFTVANTLTAQTLVVSTISSSVVYSSGSNIFGNSLSNTQVLTGSVGITGSLTVRGNQVTSGSSTITGSLTVSSGITGSLFGTASWATNFVTGSVTSASFASTASTVIATVAGTNSTELVRGNMADNDQFRILVGGTATNAGFAEIATADDGTEPIHVRQYSGVFASLVRTATLLDGSGNTSFPGTVSAAFSGNLTGTASFALRGSGSFTGSFSGSVTGSLFGTASQALTASYSLNAANAFIQGGNSFGTTATLGTNDAQALSIETNNISRIQVLNDGNIRVQPTASMKPFMDGMYIDTHPEGDNPAIIPYLGNDIAYNTLRGGTFTGTPGPGSTVVTSAATAEAMFDGAPTYAFWNSADLSGSYTASIVFPQSYNYGNTIGFSFGNAGWRARNFKVEILVTGSYYTLDTVTNWQYSSYNKSFNYAEQAVQGAKITFSNFNSTGFRIADIYLLNFNSIYGKGIYVGRDGGQIYKGITVTGSVVVTSGGFTGSLFGTASQATSASYAFTASSAISSSFAVNYLGSGSISTRLTNLETASGSLSTRVTNTETTASNLVAASASFSTRITNDSSSLSARETRTEITASNLVAASGSFSTRVTQIERTYATTGSNIFTGSQNILGAITASAALINGTLTAQTLVVSTVSSSVVYSSGSNIFGNSLSNNQTLTGSVNITGSLNVAGNILPPLTNVYNLGTGANQFKEFWVTTGIIGTAYINTIRAVSTSVIFGANTSPNYWGGFIGNSSTSSANFILNYTSSIGLGDNGYKLQVYPSGSASGSLYVSGSSSFSGSLNVSQGITGSLFGTASQAITASYALGGDASAILYQTASAAFTWSFNHFLQTQYPVFTIYDNTNSVIVPQRIQAVNTSSALIYFSSPTTGIAVASKGGYSSSVVISAVTANTAISASFASSGTGTFSGSFSGSYQGNFSGSLFGTASQATSASYAFTASSATSASLSQTASFAINAFSASNALTASFVNTLNQDVNINGAISITTTSNTPTIFRNISSYAININDTYTRSALTLRPSNSGTETVTFSRNVGSIQIQSVTTASVAQNLSLNPFGGNVGIGTDSPSTRLDVSGSTRITNNLTVSGSTQITGSVGVTGSLNVLGSITGSLSGSITGSLFGTASQAVSSSYALTASFALNAGGGGFPFTGSAQITGSLGVTGSFSVRGNQGSSVFSSNADTLLITGSLIITGSGAITGSLSVSSGITGSLFGTASQAVTASYALTASFVASIAGLSTSQIATGSITASVSLGSGSFAVTSGSSTFFFISSSGESLVNTTIAQNVAANRGNLTINGTTSILNLATSNTNAGYIYHSGTDMLIVNSKNGALTFATNNTERVRIDSSGRMGIGTSTPSASLDVSGSVRYTNGLSGTGSVNISGSLTVTGSITTNGTITAQTLVVQTITSSITYSSGSNIFGNALTNTQTMTGSVNITGSLTLRGDSILSGSLIVTGSLTGSNARFSGIITVQSASFDYGQNTNVVTGSFQVIASEATSSFRCAFFDYVMFSGSVVRAGTVTSTWSGGAVEFNESYTNDLSGSTAGVILQTALSGGNIQLQATASSQAWTIRSLIRLL